MKPKTEIFLRKSARLVAWSIVIAAGLIFIASLSIALANNPFFRTFLLFILILLGLMAILVFILWATGNENEKRISELKYLLNDEEKWHN